MSYPVLYQWTEAISKRLPCLNSWQVANVSLFSIGVMRAESCQQEQVARQVATGEQVASCARRWRRFVANERFPLTTFFTEWTAWVVSRLPAGTLYLLVDETKLHDQLAVMMVGLAWEGRCLPLAWRCYRANSSADYPQEGQVGVIERLLRSVQAGIPDERAVVVLADRGLGTSPDLCCAVAALGWSYLFRVTSMTKVCTDAGDFTIATMAQPGEQVSKAGLVFKQRGRLPAIAHARWSPGYAQPWALVTNDPTLTGWEYARRNWQEQSFRDLKSNGWHWAASRIRQPDHLARLLVLLALAYGWTLALGTIAVAQGRAHPDQRRPDGSRRRHWSLFKEGLQFFFEQLLRHHTFFDLQFFPSSRVT